MGERRRTAEVTQSLSCGRLFYREDCPSVDAEATAEALVTEISSNSVPQYGPRSRDRRGGGGEREGRRRREEEEGKKRGKRETERKKTERERKN